MSHRLEKINELIKQELGKIFLEEEEFDPDVLVTILNVKTSQDLLQATVIFSVWPTQQGEKILKKLSRHIFHIQQILNKKIRMRPVPKICFVLNADEAESQKIETLIEAIKQDEE
jgi:ribosome-binding factor A